MKTIASDIKLQYNQFKLPEIVLDIKGNVQDEFIKLKGIVLKGKELSVEIKPYRQKRSLDSNAYLWALLNEMAAKLNTTKDELYLLMLDRYGVYTHVVVKQGLVDRIKQEWRTVRELGIVTVNESTGVQLQCFFGSSTYNSKEMSTLINGVVDEAKEMGIDTMSTSELSLLNEKWGV
jgi:hypothetical protein